MKINYCTDFISLKSRKYRRLAVQYSLTTIFTSDYTIRILTGVKIQQPTCSEGASSEMIKKNYLSMYHILIMKV
jgi:hypothetical protein